MALVSQATLQPIYPGIHLPKCLNRSTEARALFSPTHTPIPPRDASCLRWTCLGERVDGEQLRANRLVSRAARRDGVEHVIHGQQKPEHLHRDEKIDREITSLFKSIGYSNMDFLQKELK